MSFSLSSFSFFKTNPNFRRVCIKASFYILAAVAALELMCHVEASSAPTPSDSKFMMGDSKKSRAKSIHVLPKSSSSPFTSTPLIYPESRTEDPSFVKLLERFRRDLLRGQKPPVHDDSYFLPTREDEKITNHTVQHWQALECKDLGLVFTTIEIISDGKGRRNSVELVEDQFGVRYARKSYKRLNQFLNELGFLSVANHPYIVKPICTISPKKSDDQSQLVMEYVAGNRSLEAAFELANKYSSECSDYENSAFIVGWATEMANWVLPVLAQLLVVIVYIHSIDYTHGDIKPENLMIDENNQIRIIDFDLTMPLPHAKKNQGTSSTISPELVGKIKGPIHEGIDWWAYGSTAAILFAVMYAGLIYQLNEAYSTALWFYTPFKYLRTNVADSGSYHIGYFPEDLPDELARFLYPFFTPDPNARQFNTKRTVEALEKMTFFGPVNWDLVRKPKNTQCRTVNEMFGTWRSGKDITAELSKRNGRDAVENSIAPNILSNLVSGTRRAASYMYNTIISPPPQDLEMHFSAFHQPSNPELKSSSSDKIQSSYGSPLGMAERAASSFTHSHQLPYMGNGGEKRGIRGSESNGADDSHTDQELEAAQYTTTFMAADPSELTPMRLKSRPIAIPLGPPTTAYSRQPPHCPTMSTEGMDTSSQSPQLRPTDTFSGSSLSRDAQQSLEAMLPSTITSTFPTATRPSSIVSDNANPSKFRASYTEAMANTTMSGSTLQKFPYCDLFLRLGGGSQPQKVSEKKADGDDEDEEDDDDGAVDDDSAGPSSIFLATTTTSPSALTEASGMSLLTSLLVSSKQQQTLPPRKRSPLVVPLGASRPFIQVGKSPVDGPSGTTSHLPASVLTEATNKSY